MIKLTFDEIVAAMDGKVRGEMPTISVSGVSTDSRGVAAGEMFFAIRGPRFDGHDFVGAALRRGAVGAVIETGMTDDVATAASIAPDSGMLIEVDNAVAALGRLGAYHRRQLSAQVIAVVGSNGKTTTKEMIDHLLGASRTGRCSPKSYNNEIGVPLTLLSADAGDEYLVVEIGTNAPGEIAHLASLAAPDMAVVTCLAEEHLEGLGDIAGVAAEEFSILEHLDEGGFAAVNIDSPEARRFAAPAGVVKVTFGHADDADLRVAEVRFEPPWLHFRLNGRFECKLHMAGAHNALNAAGAIAVARRMGMLHEEIEQRLESFVPPPMRSEIVSVGGITIINDAYNSNPHSATAAIDLLESFPTEGRRIAVFGEMRELGEQSAQLHRGVAERLRSERIASVLLVGPAYELMQPAIGGGDSLFTPSVEPCTDVDHCLERLCATAREGDVILLKASRSVGLDALVGPLRERLALSPVA